LNPVCCTCKSSG